MADEYVRIKSMLDDTDENEEQAIKNAVPIGKSYGRRLSGMFGKAKSLGSNVVNGAANVGTKVLAGGLAAVQSVSATSVAAITGVMFGIGAAGSGENYPIQYRDDSYAVNQYACLDEYADAYAGVFGTNEEQPLPEQDNNVLLRLQEINEWSKAYVGQSIPDALVCDEPDCAYYGHSGCVDASHPVKRVDNGTYTYQNSGAKIDLANVMRIRDFFREYGLTDVQIAAMCGVMTVESHIDFTSVENYNIQGERYNLDPSTSTSKFGFKPWAEGLNGSSVTTATCIHQIAAGTQPGPEDEIDYSAYMTEYPNIYKLGLGLFGFTDGPGFHNNTFLRNYADYVNDRVVLIQRLVEGSKGWRETLRKRAADLYHIAYGAKGKKERGTANNYLEEVDPSTMLILGAPKTSTGWNWKGAFEEYVIAERELDDAIKKYNEAVAAYKEAADAIRNASWSYHSASETVDGSIYEIIFENHDAVEEHVKFTTDKGSSKYVSICIPEQLTECGPSAITIHYVEYADRNDTDVVYPQMKPIYEENPIGDLSTFTLVCSCPAHPGPPPSILSPSYSAWVSAIIAYTQAVAEHAEAASLIETANGLVDAVKEAYEKEQEKLTIYVEKLVQFNKMSQEHAISVVNFYNALQDYYTASTFDIEAMIRDASFKDTTLYNDTEFFTEAAYNHVFVTRLDGERVAFRDLFKELRQDGEEDDPDSDKEVDPTVQELRLYYELWQNYAKYPTNLPRSGKYINWWTPEIQLLYMVGGSYKADLGRGIKLRDDYKFEGNPTGCPICLSALSGVKYDTAGEYYYNWMSTWKGDDYTGRDLTTATRNFFYDISSGGFDDGTLQLRTEYAYAFYYMFQYGTPYQQALHYTAVGDKAADIMDEMIAEGRWQTNMSNTLSDTAMPHNDKWKEYQTTDATRQWEIDTSTSMSYSILQTLGEEQSRSKVNLLENIWNGCRYVNVIDNSTIGNAAIYLTDDPLIYEDESNEFYQYKYGGENNSAAEPISSLYKVVYNIINQRLEKNGKSTMGGESMMTDGFTFVKTCVLWSGLDTEFENLHNAADLDKYLRESTSSIWQDTETYQVSVPTGRGNTKIWEQRKLGPYYDGGGNVYYRYRWFLVPRVLDGGNYSNSGLDWYDNMINSNAVSAFGNILEDLDYWFKHRVDEHDTNNMPTSLKGYSSDGYLRPLNENRRTADWVRVDWECWDEECEICDGKGGHGDVDMLLPGDIFIRDGEVGIWLGEDTVQAMYPLEEENEPKLVYAGGSNAQKLKSIETGIGFGWSKPCSFYINHDTPCPKHDGESNYPTSPETHDASSCNPYSPEGKWTVYRLITPNYTDAYRSAGVTRDIAQTDDWEIWYKYRYKGMEPSSDTRLYLEEVRKKLGKVINTNYNRDYLK